MKRYIVFGLVLIAASAIACGDAWRSEDFEDGIGKLKIHGDYKAGVYITSSGCQRGSCAVMERPDGYNRVEVADTDGGRAPLGEDLRYEWSIRVDENRNSGRLIVSQIHHHQGSSGPDMWTSSGNFILRHHADTNKFSLRHGFQVAPKKRKNRFASYSGVKLGQWYDVVVEARWTVEDDGFVRVYINGDLMYEQNGPTYFDYGPDTRGPYFKAGAYTEKEAATVRLDEYAVYLTAP